MRRSSYAIILLMLIAGPWTALAAQQRITAAGTVTDASGGAVTGVTVEAVANGRTVATASTGGDGRYEISAPSSAGLQLRVRQGGFTEQWVELSGDSANLTRDFVLGIAPVEDSVVVTASRTPESRVRVTGSVSVITARDIAALGTTSLADIVRTVPALNVESTGREGSQSSLFSRGGESDYNLVLLDGVRVNNNGGYYDFSRISAGEIDRVEVVRGGQSSLYGSDAIGSVVQIFTKRAGPSDAPQVSGSVEGGSFNTWRGSASLIGSARNLVDYQIGGAYRGSDGAFADILPEKDRFDQAAFDGGFGALLGDQATLRTALRYSDARGRSVGQIVYGIRDTGTAYDTKDLAWHLNFTQRLTSRLNHSALVGYFKTDGLSADRIADPTINVYAILDGTPGAIFPNTPRLVRLLDKATFDAIAAGTQGLSETQFLATTPFGAGFGDFPFTSQSEVRRPALKYQADYTWADGQVLSAGYDFERETTSLNATYRIQNHAYFVQQQLTFNDRWFATVGARMDDNSRFGTNASPKLSVGGYLLPSDSGPVSSVKVFANIGRGIKNATFSELFGGPFNDGNSDLSPERARTVDAGAEFTFAAQRLYSRIAYFDNRFNDQVAFKSSGPGLDGRADYINIDGSKANGWEVEGALQRPVAGLTAGASYALVDTEVVSFVSTSEQFQPGQPLLRRPKHSFMARAAYQRGPAAINLNVRHVGDRHDASFIGLSAVRSARFPTGRSVDITVNPGYTVVGLGAEGRVRNDVTFFVRVDNVADTEYESALGFPGLPRAAVVGARFNIGSR